MANDFDDLKKVVEIYPDLGMIRQAEYDLLVSTSKLRSRSVAHRRRSAGYSGLLDRLDELKPHIREFGPDLTDEQVREMMYRMPSPEFNFLLDLEREYRDAIALKDKAFVEGCDRRASSVELSTQSLTTRLRNALNYEGISDMPLGVFMTNYTAMQLGLVRHIGSGVVEDLGTSLKAINGRFRLGMNLLAYMPPK